MSKVQKADWLQSDHITMTDSTNSKHNHKKVVKFGRPAEATACLFQSSLKIKFFHLKMQEPKNSGFRIVKIQFM